MLVLRTSPTSPFVRKARIGMALCGLTDRIRLEPSDTLDPKDSVRAQNPLGKIPVVITEDGSAIYDSRVILEYFDGLAGGGRILPPAGSERIEALRLQALADGIMDAAILQIYEGRFRPQEKHEPRWLEHQAGKVARALDQLEKAPPPLKPAIHVGHIALACALGYLDFRFAGRWRADHPRLADWLDEFAWKVPAFDQSKPSAQ
jgi:glutathione S-transferase